MTNKKQNNELTLSIFPKPKGFGYALVENVDTIIDYGIAQTKDKTSEGYRKRFCKILETYRPSVVILEDYKSKSVKKCKRIEKIIDTFKQEAHQRALKCYHYKREDIRKVFEEFKAFTKYEIAKTIGDWKEELQIFVPNKRKIWEPENYRMAIFDAFSLIITHHYLEK